MVMIISSCPNGFSQSPPGHYRGTNPFQYFPNQVNYTQPILAPLFYYGPTNFLPTHDNKHPILCKWNRGFPGVTVVNCDGSYKPSRRCSGYGFIVRDHSGNVITAKAMHKEKDSASDQHISDEIKVLQLELKAIRDGLVCVRHLGVRLVEFRSDSKNGIAIIMGENKCPRECLAILREIQVEIGHFGPNIIFQFVYRESNRAADFLSKFCMFDGEITLEADDLPEKLQRIIFEDAMGFGVLRQPKHKISDL